MATEEKKVDIDNLEAALAKLPAGPYSISGQRSLLHLETDCGAPIAGEHVFSVPKKHEAYAVAIYELLNAAPQLIAAYRRQEYQEASRNQEPA